MRFPRGDSLFDEVPHVVWEKSDKSNELILQKTPTHSLIPNGNHETAAKTEWMEEIFRYGCGLDFIQGLFHL